MSKITIPDFKQWAKQLTYGRHDSAITEALKQAFEQGRALGTTQEWWEPVDKDDHYQNHPLLHVGEDATIDITQPEED